MKQQRELFPLLKEWGIVGVTPNSILKLNLQPKGGTAVRFTPLDNMEANKYSDYK